MNNTNGGNNNSKNIHNDKHVQDLQRSWKERQDEMRLLERFKLVATSRLETIAQRQQVESSSSSSPQQQQQLYKLGTEERKIIQQMNNMGLLPGIGASIATFLILRRGPIYLTRMLLRRKQNQQHQQQQGFNQDIYRSNHNYNNTHNHHSHNSPSSSTTKTTTSSSNPFHRAKQIQQEQQQYGYNLPPPPGTTFVGISENVRSKNWFIRSIWFTFDVTLSIMMGASVSMAYTDTNEIRQQIVELPLVSGRSLVSDVLCDDIVNELTKIQLEHSPTYQRLVQDIHRQRNSNSNNPNNNKKNNERSLSSHPYNVNAFYLESIGIFAQNCQRRRYAEQQRVRDRDNHDFLFDNESTVPSSSSSSTSSTAYYSQPPIELTERVPPNGPRLVVIPTHGGDSSGSSYRRSSNNDDTSPTSTPTRRRVTVVVEEDDNDSYDNDYYSYNDSIDNTFDHNHDPFTTSPTTSPSIKHNSIDILGDGRIRGVDNDNDPTTITASNEQRVQK